MKKLLALLLLFAVTLGAQTPPLVSPQRGLVRPTSPVSRTFSMLADPAPVSALSPIKVTPGKPYNQTGSTCTIAAWHGWLETNASKPVYVIKNPNDWGIPIYIWATKHDQWDDNDGDINGGTDPYVVSKRLKQLGYVTGIDVLGLLYEREVRPYVAKIGPVVLAGPWFSSMDRPLRATGQVVVDAKSDLRGGHAFLCFMFRPAETVHGIDYPARYYCLQSWLGYGPFDILPDGPQIFWISAGDLRKWMNWGGYAYYAVKSLPKVK